MTDGAVIRNGSQADVPFLRALLAHAYGWRVNQLEAEIPLTRYVDNWGRRGDAALVAMEEGSSVGAAWLRLFRASAPGYGFVDEETPELTMAIVPSRRQHGLGSRLLEALLARAEAAGHGAVSLSVEAGSPAVGFYERHGFERVGAEAGGLVMRRAL
jgi:GNAT superfamily N-acetyltransferase